MFFVFQSVFLKKRKTETEPSSFFSDLVMTDFQCKFGMDPTHIFM